jgi:hypothetical protein
MIRRRTSESSRRVYARIIGPVHDEAHLDCLSQAVQPFRWASVMYGGRGKAPAKLFSPKTIVNHSSRFGLRACPLHRKPLPPASRPLPAVPRLYEPLAFAVPTKCFLQPRQLVVGQVCQVDEVGVGTLDLPDQRVQLEQGRLGRAVLLVGPRGQSRARYAS